MRAPIERLEAAIQDGAMRQDVDVVVPKCQNHPIFERHWVLHGVAHFHRVDESHGRWKRGLPADELLPNVDDSRNDVCHGHGRAGADVAFVELVDHGGGHPVKSSVSAVISQEPYLLNVVHIHRANPKESAVLILRPPENIRAPRVMDKMFR